jgi:hypothetical protein
VTDWPSGQAQLEKARVRGLEIPYAERAWEGFRNLLLVSERNAIFKPSGLASNDVVEQTTAAGTFKSFMVNDVLSSEGEELTVALER